MALLELEAPFDVRDVQLARRRMAKRWHPDIAPPGKQHEHQRHLQAINDMADELERLAEGARGGRISRNAAQASAAAARKAREEAGRRDYEAEQRARAAAAERIPPRPVRQPRPRPLRRAPLRALRLLSGVGRRQRHRDLLHGRGRRRPPVGARPLQPGHPHGAGRQPAVRRLLDPRSGRRPRRALHDRGAARARRGRLRARRAAPDLCARRRPDERAGAADDDARVLAGRQPRRGGARGARLGAGRRRAPGGAPLRRPHLRGHGRDRPRRRGGRSAPPSGRPRTPASGRGSGGCGCG